MGKLLRLTAAVFALAALLPGIAQAASLTTTFAGGNGSSGNTFDLEVLSPGGVLITGIEAHLVDEGHDEEVQVWTRPETAVGHENSAAGWELRDTATVNPLGSGSPTPMPISFYLPPGSYGFLVGPPEGAVDYTDGAAVYEDAALKLTSGTGVEAPFLAGGSVYSPRIWNGTIEYDYIGSPAISSGPTGTTRDRQPTFEFSFGDISPGFECRIPPAGVESILFGPCSGAKSDTPSVPLADGSYRFEVRIAETDPTLSPPVSRNFTVDTTPPPAPNLIAGPEGPTSDRSPRFDFTLAPGATPQCRLFARGAQVPEFGPCTSAASFQPAVALADGDYDFEVRAVDAIGNASAPVARRFSVVPACDQRLRAQAQKRLTQAQKSLAKARAALRRARSSGGTNKANRAKVARAKAKVKKARQGVRAAQRQLQNLC